MNRSKLKARYCNSDEKLIDQTLNLFISSSSEKLEKKVSECMLREKTVIQCSKWGKEFGSMKNLRKHRLKECKGDNSVRNFECDECDKLLDE